jgi:hypothetical protein
MTETSLFPRAAAFAGIAFEDLAERILLGASLKIESGSRLNTENRKLKVESGT